MKTNVGEDNYIFYNRNPDGKKTEDCVCRAISTATGLKYSTIKKLLKLSAEKHECSELCIGCYHYLLEDIFGYRVSICDGETVKEVARKNRGEKVLIRIDGHLTVSIYGTVFDIWDCTNEYVDCYWIVK